MFPNKVMLEARIVPLYSCSSVANKKTTLKRSSSSSTSTKMLIVLKTKITLFNNEVLVTEKQFVKTIFPENTINIF